MEGGGGEEADGGACWVTRPGGWWSPAALARVGWPSAEVVGREGVKECAREGV